jgi:hypothetical protein
VFSKRHAIGVDGAAMRIGRDARRAGNVLLTRDNKQTPSRRGDSVSTHVRAFQPNVRARKSGHTGRSE